jgi:MFS family permease
LGQGLVTPTLASVVAGRVPDDQRGAALGAQQSAGGLARIVGPVLGGLAFERIGVGAPYVGGVVLLGLAAAMVTTAAGREAADRAHAVSPVKGR